MYRFVIWCILCQLGPFSLAQSHMHMFYTATYIEYSLLSNDKATLASP